MFIYILLATFLFVLSLAEGRLQSQQKTAFWCFCFILLVLFDGLRWQSGTDWENYFYYFRGCLTDQNEFDSLFEPGFVFINETIRKITDNYSVFLLIHALIVYLGFFSFIRKYSPLPFLSLFLLFVNLLPYQGMNRQLIAMVICMFSLRYLLDGKTGYFLLCILFAMLFHTTSLLFLVALFMNRRFSLKTYVVILSVASLVCLSGVMSYIANVSLNAFGGAIGVRIATYLGGEMYEASLMSRLLGLMMRALFIVPFLYAMYRKVQLPKVWVFFFNMYLVGCLLYMFFHGSIFQIFVSRGAFYFNILQIILIPYIVLLYRKAFSRQSMLIFVCIISVFLMVRALHNYDYGDYNPFVPYTSVVSGQDAHKNIYFN